MIFKDKHVRGFDPASLTEKVFYLVSSWNGWVEGLFSHEHGYNKQCKLRRTQQKANSYYCRISMARKYVKLHQIIHKLLESHWIQQSSKGSSRPLISTSQPDLNMSEPLNSVHMYSVTAGRLRSPRNRVICVRNVCHAISR